MEQTLDISIITVVRNRIGYIAETMDSVLRQDYAHIEYIVVDGASDDGTAELVAAYAQRHAPKLRYVSEPDSGIYDAMNKGLRMASGDVVAFLNAGDIYEADDVVGEVARRLRASGHEALYGDLVYVKENNTQAVVRKWISGKYHRRKFYFGWMPPHPTFFCARRLFERHGLFLAHMELSADYEFMLRLMLKHGVAPLYYPRVMVRMRAGGAGNLSFRARLKANIEDRMAWRANQLKPYFFTLYWKPLSKIKQFFIR